MRERPDKEGGLGPALIVVPLAVLCCLGPLVVVYGVGSGFFVSLFGWLSGIDALVFVGLGVTAVVGVAYLLRGRRATTGLGVGARNAKATWAKRRAKF